MSTAAVLDTETPIIEIPESSKDRGRVWSQDTSLNTIALERAVPLVRILRDHSADMDDRFDAALALRQQEKAIGTMKYLLKLVDASTKPGDESTPREEVVAREKLGKMAAIALQEQVCRTPEIMSTMRDWLREGHALFRREEIEASEQQEASQSQSKLWVPPSIRKEYENNITPEESARRDQIAAKFTRAVMILGSPKSEEAEGLLYQVAVSDNVDQFTRYFALQGLTGVESATAAAAFICHLVGSGDTTEFLIEQSVINMSSYIPTVIREELKQYAAELSTTANLARLSLQTGMSNRLNSIKSQLLAAVDKNHSPEDAERARFYHSAECWRALMHMQDTHNKLGPSLSGRNIVETREPGTVGDLVYSIEINSRQWEG